MAHQLATGAPAGGGDAGGMPCTPGGGSGPLRIDLHLLLALLGALLAAWVAAAVVAWVAGSG